MGMRFFLKILLLLLVFFALIELRDPFSIRPDQSFQAPGSTSWFGTDRLGRDVFSRTGRALRNTVIDAGMAEIAGFMVAMLMALTAVRRFRWLALLDEAVESLSVALRSVPALLPAMSIAVIFRDSPLSLPAALFIISIIYTLPVYRAEIRRASEAPYIEGAVALGASPWNLVVNYILPESLPRMLRYATLDFASLVAFASLFGLVGLTTPPEPNLGEMIFDARSYMIEYPWLFLAPSIVLVLSLVSIWQFRPARFEED